jgi:hypothetical protein
MTNFKVNWDDCHTFPASHAMLNDKTGQSISTFYAFVVAPNCTPVAFTWTNKSMQNISG